MLSVPAGRTSDGFGSLRRNVKVATLQTTKDLQSCNLNASCGIVPPFYPVGRNALLIRSVKSAFALLLTRVTELWQAERMGKIENETLSDYGGAIFYAGSLPSLGAGG